MSTKANHSSAAEPGRRAPAPAGVRLVRLAFAAAGRVAPAIMARWAYRLWFKTRRFPVPGRDARVLATAQHPSLLVNKVPVAVYAWGSGPTVLLVHGWHGHAGHFTGFVQPLVETGFRALAFDAPAHGATPGDRTNIFEIAEVISALAERFGPLHAVITHSFGTPCATLALDRGIRANAIVCISPPARMEGLFASFAETLRLPAGVQSRFRQMLEREFGDDVWERLSPAAHARSLRIPALVIHDRDDRAVPLGEGRALARAWGGARLIETEGLGHRRILTDPQAIKQAVSFVREHGSPRVTGAGSSGYL